MAKITCDWTTEAIVQYVNRVEVDTHDPDFVQFLRDCYVGDDEGWVDLSPRLMNQALTDYINEREGLRPVSESKEAVADHECVQPNWVRIVAVQS